MNDSFALLYGTAVSEPISHKLRHRDQSEITSLIPNASDSDLLKGTLNNNALWTDILSSRHDFVYVQSSSCFREEEISGLTYSANWLHLLMEMGIDTI